LKQLVLPGDFLDVEDTCLVRGVNGGSSGGEWLYAVGDINHRVLLNHVGKYQGRAYSTAIITCARGTRNISNDNNNYQQDNSGLDSGNNSNSDANQENRGL
jgi:hypothetical protein